MLPNKSPRRPPLRLFLAERVSNDVHLDFTNDDNEDDGAIRILLLLSMMATVLALAIDADVVDGACCLCGRSGLVLHWNELAANICRTSTRQQQQRLTMLADFIVQ